MDSAYILTSAYCCRHRIGTIVILIIDVVAVVFGALILVALYPNTSVQVSWLPPLDPELRGQMIAFIFALTFGAAAAVVLIFGVSERWHECVVAYLVLSSIAIIICIVTWIWLLCVLKSAIPWYIILITTIFMLLSLYHWVIVYSYYIILKVADDQTSDVTALSGHGIFQRLSL